MKVTMSWAVVCAAIFCNSASCAPFACDQIKDKKVRAACVDSERENSVKAAETRATTEKDNAELLEKKAALASFIQRSKARLTANYKDPSSAQFTDLVVVTQNGWNSALCGSVNGKNSYGGYVGAKKFYVHWWSDKDAEIWSEGASTEKYSRSEYLPLLENAAKIRASEIGLAELICSKSALNVATSVE